MKHIVRSVLAACLAVSLGAGRAAAQMPGLSPADSKELASYRLSMDTAKKVFGAMRSLVMEMQKDPKVQALMKTETEIEALEKKDELTDAESERLDKLRAQRDQQKEAVEAANSAGVNLSNAASLDEMEAQIKGQPQAMAALSQAGLSAREYSRFMIASLMAGMVASFQKSGMIKELPKELKEIPAENIQFMNEHAAELEQMRKELEAVGKGMS